MKKYLFFLVLWVGCNPPPKKDTAQLSKIASKLDSITQALDSTARFFGRDITGYEVFAPVGAPIELTEEMANETVIVDSSALNTPKDFLLDIDLNVEQPIPSNAAEVYSNLTAYVFSDYLKFDLPYKNIQVEMCSIRNKIPLEKLKAYKDYYIGMRKLADTLMLKGNFPVYLDQAICNVSTDNFAGISKKILNEMNKDNISSESDDNWLLLSRLRFSNWGLDF